MHTRFRTALKQSDFLLGSWVSSSDPSVVEAITGADLDFVIIDSEHGPLGPAEVQLMTMAAARSDTAVLVRVGGSDTIRLMQPLDSGADGVVVPRVQSADEVRAVVAATRYPPIGMRGYGPRRAGGYGRLESEYVASSEERVVVLVQVETEGAVESLNEIAGVEGLDGLLVGRNDLSASLGLARQPNHPRVLEVVDRVVEACQEAGIAAGIASGADADEVARWRDAGMRFVSAGMDMEFLVKGVDRFVEAVRGTSAE